MGLSTRPAIRRDRVGDFQQPAAIPQQFQLKFLGRLPIAEETDHPYKEEKLMYRRSRKIAASLLLLGFAVSCSSYDRFPIASFSTRLQDGDRHLGWSLTISTVGAGSVNPNTCCWQKIILSMRLMLSPSWSQIRRHASMSTMWPGSVELGDVDYWQNYNLKPSTTVRPSVG